MILKTAYRNLIKQKKSLFINLTGLSIGMAAALLILIWVDNELNYDNYHTKADQIYRITNHLEVSKGEVWVWENSPYLLSKAVQEEIPEVETSTLFLDGTWNPLIFRHNGNIVKESKVAYADSSWFNTFHYERLYGSLDNFNTAPDELVITASAAKKYFGTEQAVGQSLKADTVTYTVKAVIADPPTNSSFKYDVIASLATILKDPNRKSNDQQWGNFNYMTFIRLNEKANKASTEKKLTDLLRKRKDDKAIRITLTGLKDIHFETGLQNSVLKHSNKKIVNVFSIVALLIILTACINYVNLSTARASLRAKEVSIRKINGAGTGSLFLQFMAESLIVSCMALLLTLLLVQISLPYFNLFTENHFSLYPGNSNLLLLIAGILICSTLLNGIYPAILLSSFKPLNVLRGYSLPAIKDGYFRKILVVTQFSISVVLISGTLIAYQQMQLIQKQNDQYNKDQIMKITVPWSAFRGKTPEERNSILQSMKPEFMQIPGVTRITQAGGSIVELLNSSSGGFDWDGRDKEFNPSFAVLSVDTGFARIFNLKIKEGEWFRDPSQASKAYILNETAVREIGIRQPVIGQRFTRSGDTGVVIGVVKDFHFKSIHEKISPLFIHLHNGWFNTSFIEVSAGNSSQVIAGLEKKWRNFFPGLPFEYSFLNEDFNNLYKTDHQIMRLMLLFAMITIFVAALGLFGLAAFTAEKKVKEIGIRKVLGANVINIVQLLSKEFFWLVLISVLVATPIAWWVMNSWLHDYQYRINITPWIFLLAGCISLLIALITVSIQAVKAANANPVNSLRSE